MILDPAEAKRAAAQRAKTATRVNLGTLKFWNYEPCEHHDTPRADCEWRKCGGGFYDHQTRSIAFHYLTGRSMDASVTGAGKTIISYGLLALLKQKGELTKRALVVCQTPAVLQWLQEGQRFTPKLHIEAIYSGLSRPQRIQRYSRNYDVLIIGYHMLLKDRALLEKLGFGIVISDDVDPLLNHSNATHKAVVRLARMADRSVVFNATNIQTSLSQIHAASMAVGGFDTWGSLRSFERRYLRQEPITIYTRGGRKMQRLQTTGYKNMTEFKQLLSPMVIRSTYEDFGKDLKMPEVMPPQDIWLELHPEQRRRYDVLQEGVLKIIKEEGTRVKHATALTKVGYGQQICAGLPALGEADGPQASVKLDWVMRQVTGEWADQKIVVFIKNLGMVEALQNRLKAAGVGCATIWGREADAMVRKGEVDRFWQDPKCRVIIGTAAIERSLNLQNASILVCVDTHLNPARMTQILGRIRRIGSKHDHIFVFNLFAIDTQEERYTMVLRMRQALSDFVWDEQSDLYEKLSALQLLELIKP